MSKQNTLDSDRIATTSDSLDTPITSDPVCSPVVASPTHPVHPKGKNARILFSSVFGPYAQDDEYGSRSINPMELYHNQVTRVQGPFSLRMFHRSWGIMMIQNNLEAPCVLLDFPSLERFTREIQENDYDIIGITSIYPNILKVKKMCELIRQYQPQAKIVIGGHIANVAGLKDRVGADYTVQGEGIIWFRRFTGQDDSTKVKHPIIVSGLKAHTAGIKISEKPEDTAAVIIPSVGCPLGCNFCSTSAMFGGKGRFINFYETGDDLFSVMEQTEQALNTQSFFIMDENFLFHRNRALRLLDLMIEHNKSWSLYVFTSANVLQSYTIEQLIRLGVSWVWMGIEGEDSRYTKLKGIDSRKLVSNLQSHGIRILGSTIIGLENHTPENIQDVIDYAAAHDTDFHQFMLYTPVSGTALHREMSEKGRLKSEEEVPPNDIHGQYRFNYHHDHIKDGQESKYLLQAFETDFAVNGPSIVRVGHTLLKGWIRYRNHSDQAIRKRYQREGKELFTTFAALTSAIMVYYKKSPALHHRMKEQLKGLHKYGGLKAHLYSLAGRFYLLPKIRSEERKLNNGITYEPPTYYEGNEAFMRAICLAGPSHSKDMPARAAAVAVAPRPK
ncbi:MAG: cobalamin-dependent protein [Verrucomicrobiota bacterium]|nr:cobalamin-dependent protein [Verrucomicrobiota bacterium]